MKFEDMNIEKSVLDSLNSIGFEELTRIQSETIPIIKQGHDVIGQSETGSGKTAAFGIPLVEKVLKGNKVQALILAPTRELSLQIAGELTKFSRFKGLNIQTVYGGVPLYPQVSGLRKSEIVVGTPGRLLDHMRRGTLDTKNLRMFVIDEADKMIDMGFVDDIREIERNIPRNRQTLMFSATMSESLIKIRDSFTKNAKKVKTETKVREDVLKQYYCDVDIQRRFSLLVHLIRQEQVDLAIVFCNSRRDVDSVSRNLRDNGINAIALHGGLPQSKREKIIEGFHRATSEILVATDVAARGLDIKNITHIFNYNIPKNIEDYVNRIGRTARAGEKGKAISLLTREDYDSFRRILNTYSYDIEKMDVSNFDILPFRKHVSMQADNRRFKNYSRYGSDRRFTSIKRRRFGGRDFGRRPRKRF
jgi:ATP-dependent RNA helicase DeaD